MDTQLSKLATVTYSSGAELIIPATGPASSIFLSWLSESKALAKGGLAIVKGKDAFRIRLYSGSLTDLEDAKNFINSNMPS